MFRSAALSTAVMLFPAITTAADWDILDFNPVESDSDIVLPMPCGGAMVFVPVVTGDIAAESNRLFGDKALWLGWGGARETAFQEAEWREYVSGGLTDGENRFYLIAKYEVTADQYTAIVEKPCETPGGENVLPSEDAGLPAAGKTWFEAVAFSDAYTRYLYEKHPDLLPDTFGGGAFVRLPTEAEWEFATRGGTKVSDTERRNERFPLTGTIKDYGWYAGSDSARGELQFIGGLDPNPLGLHDVYGNVGELVLEGFRANKAGRLHGQVGAATIKGGSFLSAPTALKSGARLELAHYSRETGSVVRRRDIGFRPVITGLVTGDLQHAQAMANSWDSLGDIQNEDGSVLDRLRLIADQTSDLPLRAAINEAATAIGSEIREREEREKEALENLVMSASIMATRLHSLHFRVERVREVYGLNEGRTIRDAFEDNADENRLFDETQTFYDELMQEFGTFAEVYADAFLQVTERYEPEPVVDIAREQGRRHADRGRIFLRDSTFAFGVQVRDFDSDAGWDRKQVIVDLMKIFKVEPNEPEWLDEALRN